MRRIPLLILIGLAATLPALSGGGTPPSPASQVSPLRGDVYFLSGRGGNVGFYAGPDAVFVVDSLYEDAASGLLEEIRKITDRPVKYLLNTHHHADHVGGNAVFSPFALILAHENVRKRMLASREEDVRDYPGIPVLTFDSELRLHLREETIQVWHLPGGHTDGDSVVYFEKARILHGGDLVWNRVIPYIDPRAGGSAKGHAAVLDEILRRLPPDAKIIPGHGQVMGLEGLRAFRRYFTDLLDAAGKAKSSGISREEFLKNADLPAYRDYGGYPDRFKDNCAAAYDQSP